MLTLPLPPLDEVVVVLDGRGGIGARLGIGFDVLDFQVVELPASLICVS